MKKMKQTIMAVLCFVWLCSSAATVHAVTPRGAVIQCPQCMSGELTERTSRAYEHDERFPCEHKKKGVDVFGCYEVTIRRECSNCNYRTTYTYTDHVLKSCNGYN